MTLSKSDKKIYHKLHDIALEKDMTKYNNDVIKIIEKYKKNQLDFKETYLKIYEKVTQNDKKVAWRYDGISGSHYFNKILEFYANDLITEEDIQELSEDVRNRLIQIKQIHL
jgi:hypothetical protein